MKRLYLFALTAALLTILPACVALAQNAPATGNDAPAPAASPAPAPAASPAPAATPAASPSASTPPADTTKKTATRKKKSGKVTRQQEIDHSISSGTVPSRYRSQVPKEYQHYIPFDKQ